jgi:hypothetical protein
LKNNRLTRNMPVTQIIVGRVKKSHLLLINTNPKCDTWVNANADPSTIDAFLSPIELAYTGMHNAPEK